jgi:GcrA cell cycle regulator
MAKTQKTISTLEHNDCRWPVGDPKDTDFHFCGAPKLAARPYCELHWRMAFQPARARESRPSVIALTSRAA